jgi:hypothetical protein
MLGTADGSGKALRQARSAHGRQPPRMREADQLFA